MGQRENNTPVDGFLYLIGTKDNTGSLCGARESLPHWLIRAMLSISKILFGGDLDSGAWLGCACTAEGGVNVCFLISEPVSATADYNYQSPKTFFFEKSKIEFFLRTFKH